MQFSSSLKAIISIALIQTILLATIVFSAFNLVQQQSDQNLAMRANQLVDDIAEQIEIAFENDNKAGIANIVDDYALRADIAYIRVFDAYNQIILAVGNPSDTRRDNQIDSFAKLHQQGRHVGRLEVGINPPQVTNTLHSGVLLLAGLAFLHVVIVAAYSYRNNRKGRLQLSRLETVASNISQAVSSGDFTDCDLPVGPDSELAKVAQSINSLIANLKLEYEQRAQYENMLGDFSRTLEDKVNERTQALAKRNKQLQQTNQDLKTAKEQLLQAEKMASVGQLAAGVAHEINNPIGFVNSNLSALQDYIGSYCKLVEILRAYLQSQDVFERKALLGQMNQVIETENLDFLQDDIPDLLKESQVGLDRVKSIVQGLKLFSRADSDEKQNIDINEVVSTTLNMVSNELKYHCEIETDLTPIPKISVNVGKISQVLTNLMINAGQAIENQGKIKISTRQEDDWVKVAIADTGKGIAKAHLNHLFDPFFTTKPEGEGTGLGLSISYGIAQDHGGNISVSSKEGVGSCFVLSLPIHSGDEPSIKDEQGADHV